MILVWSVGAFLFGLAVGSFLNVVAYRVPSGLSVVNPPSACPRCGHEIRNRHNVPVLGWLVLRGRCYDCKSPISPRYPAVEAVTGLLFAVLTARLVQVGWLPTVLPALAVAAFVVVAALAELDRVSLPKAAVLAVGVPALVALAATALAVGAWLPLAAAAIAAAATGAVVVVTHRPQRYLLVLWPAALAVLLIG